MLRETIPIRNCIFPEEIQIILIREGERARERNKQV